MKGRQMPDHTDKDGRTTAITQDGLEARCSNVSIELPGDTTDGA